MKLRGLKFFLKSNHETKKLIMEITRFTVVYAFKVKEGKEATFIHAWKELTRLIYSFEGSYGSRLHKADGALYIAYAQWPDKETWENSGSKLPKIATQWKLQVRESCVDITTEYEMYVIEDELKNSRNDEKEEKEV